MSAVSIPSPFLTRVWKNVPIHSIDCYDTVLGTVTGNMVVIKIGTPSSRSFRSRVNEEQWLQRLMNHELERTAEATKQCRGDPNPYEASAKRKVGKRQPRIDLKPRRWWGRGNSTAGRLGGKDVLSHLAAGVYWTHVVELSGRIKGKEERWTWLHGYLVWKERGKQREL